MMRRTKVSVTFLLPRATALMVTVPRFLAVTMPEEEPVAIAVLEELQVTRCSAPLGRVS